MSGTILKQRPSTLSREDFLKIYGGVYEHSAWIAEAAFNKAAQSIDTVEALHAQMKDAVTAAPREKKLALIKAHPDLACAPAEAAKLSKESTSEQAGAGLKQCTPEEYAEFQQLNADYKTKFGFPFIIAVKGLNRQDILQAFRQRIHNEEPVEFDTALTQIHKIAFLRLMALT